MKIFFRRIHLYLSLAAGLVILIACLTGAILVFEKEAQMALHRDRSDAEASRLATMDPLTGTYNRRTFLEIAESAGAWAGGTGRFFAIGGDGRPGACDHEALAAVDRAPGRLRSEAGLRR